MSKRELSRLKAIERVESKCLLQKLAAKELGISVRHLRRLQGRYRLDGASGLVSQRRGSPSNNRLSESFKLEVMSIVRENYADFGPTLACEKLEEVHGLRIGKESLRGLMIAEGLWAPRKTPKPVIHQMRERRARRGELVQIDGSPHDWFEGRSAACTLLVYVDDATGELLHLEFVEVENTHHYFAATGRYITRHGKPLAFYSDRHGVFRVNSKQAHETKAVTQFGRAVEELDIKLITANSPQVKGRVERMNETLQDRLVKEMRLQGINTMEEANTMLPSYIADFNARFAKPARDPRDAHRALTRGECLETILTKQETRQLSKNLTIQYNGVIYQIKTRRPGYALRNAKVLVCENSKGEVIISRKGKVLEYEVHHEHGEQGKVVSSKEINVMLDRPRSKVQVAHRSPTLPADHPWRRNTLFSKRRPIAAL